MVTNFRGSAIRVFSVDSKTAALTLEGAPYPNNQRAMCWAVLGPDGKTLYASNYVTNNVSVFSIIEEDTLDLIGNSAPKHFSRPGASLIARNCGFPRMVRSSTSLDRLPPR